jgi:hypothetical protein
MAEDQRQPFEARSQALSYLGTERMPPPPVTRVLGIYRRERDSALAMQCISLLADAHGDEITQAMLEHLALLDQRLASESADVKTLVIDRYQLIKTLHRRIGNRVFAWCPDPATVDNLYEGKANPEK